MSVIFAFEDVHSQTHITLNPIEMKQNIAIKLTFNIDIHIEVINEPHYALVCVMLPVSTNKATVRKTMKVQWHNQHNNEGTMAQSV